LEAIERERKEAPLTEAALREEKAREDDMQRSRDRRGSSRAMDLDLDVEKEIEGSLAVWQSGSLAVWQSGALELSNAFLQQRVPDGSCFWQERVCAAPPSLLPCPVLSCPAPPRPCLSPPHGLPLRIHCGAYQGEAGDGRHQWEMLC
jgi:hypothetical protein